MTTLNRKVSKMSQAEDGRIGADSESQRRKRGRRNAGASAQDPERVPKVVEHTTCPD